MARRSKASEYTPEGWPPWAPKALEIYSEVGIVTLAAKGAGVHPVSVHTLKRENEAFAAAWKDADEQAGDALEAEALRRARDGSDTLLIFLLKRKRPEFRDNYHVQVSGNSEQPLRLEVQAFAQIAEEAEKHLGTQTQEAIEEAVAEIVTDEERALGGQ